MCSPSQARCEERRNDADAARPPRRPPRAPLRGGAGRRRRQASGLGLHRLQGPPLPRSDGGARQDYGRRRVASAVSFGETGDRGTACRDSRDKLVAPSWRTFEAYLVDAASIPAPLRPSDALAELIAAHAAWKSRFATECTATPAGLDHVESSPALTMFPIVHDGDDTLGLGDMKGLLALY